MGVWINTIIAVLAVSLLSLIGVFTLGFSKDRLRKVLVFMVSFSAGSLFGGAIFHLIPEGISQLGSGLEFGLYLISGIVLFYVLENFIHWRHCHIPTSDDHPHPHGTMNIIGDGLHNLIDGMVIAGAFLAGPQIGVATTIAVALHEIPQEIGDFGVLLHAGYSRSKALLFNLGSALVAVIGAVIVLLLQGGGFVAGLLPFTAGGFIYIAGSDLIPELRKDVYPMSKLVKQFFFMVLGIAVMIGLLYLE